MIVTCYSGPFSALWQFQSVHGALPSNAVHLSELETIANQLIVIADVNKQSLTAAPRDLLECVFIYLF